MERAVRNAWDEPAPLLFCTPARTHFHGFQMIDTPPMDRQMKMSPCGMVFFYKDGFPPQVQIPKGHRTELLGHFLVGSDFAEDEINKKLGLGLFSQVKQGLIAPSKHLREAGLSKAEDKAESRTK